MFDQLPAAVAALDAASSLGALAGRLLLGAVVGVAAAVVMAIPMWRQDDGFTPAYVAAAVVRRTTPDEVSFGDANVAHHAAGALAGVLYAVVYLLTDALAPDLAVAGIDLPSHLVATAVVVAFIYVAFARFIFPRAGRRIYVERATAVRGQWLRSSLVFGATLLVLAPAIFTGFA
ncbi:MULTISPECIES: hypothetical protein [unclassified Haloferax]|uniref:hypothetical protein n=1 Tax=unclassified Haloferax TaxID=2625095 RepID=UPI0002B08574|nr:MULTISPECIES: hypothetical protein [unclassified Haloferax]ELZ55310.1 hypothetical protein C460_16632 [Haloferax sp. ATCC BAA-646]ELZ66567.1 hypothetical protein C459_04030 [Haloferax sp. ATCC BAA-645]ELZ66756.1 hypothetical protein C458_11945 [Haloferax sp. ATCC BAA-644]